MKVTVDKILGLSCFEGSLLTAGQKGIQREVTAVTVAELPDSAEWLMGGELVMTTGYYFKDDVQKQCSWIRSLIEKGASALAIKPGRFIGKTHIQLVELAEEFGFPIIELPIQSYWPIIIKDVTNAIQNYQGEVIRRAEEIHNRLTDIVLEGKGIQDIADTLANLVNNPILVEDCLLHTLASTNPQSDDQEMGKFLAFRNSLEYKDIFRQKREFKEMIQIRRKEMIADMIPFEGRKIVQKTLPILANQVLYGFVSLLEYEKPAIEIDMVALEHGATTIALEMMKERVSMEHERRLRNSFLNELLEGDVEKVIASYVKYKFVDYDILKPSVMILVSISGNNHFWIDQSNEHIFIENQEERMARMIKKIFAERDPNVFVNIKDNICYILYHYLTDKPKKEILENARQMAGKMVQRLRDKFPNNEFSVGIGDPYQQLADLKRSYHTANTSLQLGRKFFGENQVAVYDDLGILRLLSLIDKSKEIENFCFDIIGNLVQHDKEHNDSMCETLETYLRTNGNIAESARLLYIHSNTLTYRLKKIASILQRDINDAQIRFNLYLALIVKRLFLDAS
jgi:purine catabolism regulator